ncbi:MAG: GDCCVxC domain-containing (seleno)protein [Gammaproteobacteria bacterium]|nr:GDCCVxC domain-containing (seleno)protein [Gammaproteobacteria bacterium]
MTDQDLHATLTRPACAVESTAQMPTDACLYFYDCPHCGTRLKPRPGDCCVFCSYGDRPCPPVQASRAGPSGPGRG